MKSILCRASNDSQKGTWLVIWVILGMMGSFSNTSADESSDSLSTSWLMLRKLTDGTESENFFSFVPTYGPVYDVSTDVGESGTAIEFSRESSGFVLLKFGDEDVMGCDPIYSGTVRPEDHTIQGDIKCRDGSGLTGAWRGCDNYELWGYYYCPQWPDGP